MMLRMKNDLSGIILKKKNVIDQYFSTCSVSTKFATAPSSLTPRTLNLVPARSQLNLTKVNQKKTKQR